MLLGGNTSIGHVCYYGFVLGLALAIVRSLAYPIVQD